MFAGQITPPNKDQNAPLVQQQEGDQQRPVEGKALFLAGLSEACQFTDLHKFFEPFGTVVLCRVLKDAKTGKSRRVGYVNYDRAEHAAAALAALNGTPGPGGAIFDIKLAAQDPTFKPVETKKVFVRYVPVTVSEAQLRAAFAQFGTIDDCVLSRDLSRTARREPGPWNMAYVTYARSKDAIDAVARAASLVRFGDQELTVKPAVSEETLRLRTKNRQQQQQQEQQQHQQHNNNQQQQTHQQHVQHAPQQHHQVQRPQQLASTPMAPFQAAPPAFQGQPPGTIPVFVQGLGMVFMPVQQQQQQQVQQVQQQHAMPMMMVAPQAMVPQPLQQQQPQQEQPLQLFATVDGAFAHPQLVPVQPSVFGSAQDPQLQQPIQQQQSLGTVSPSSCASSDDAASGLQSGSALIGDDQHHPFGAAFGSAVGSATFQFLQTSN